MVTRVEIDEISLQAKYEKYLIPIVILSISMFVGLLLATFQPLSGPIIVFSRVVFSILGPFLAFLTYFLLGFKLLNIELKDRILEILLFTLVCSVLGIFFAITLNTRSILLILVLASLEYLSVEFALFLATAVLVPIIEEFVKIYAALIMARLVNRSRESRFIYQPQLFIFLGLIGGAIFNLLETYWYTWAGASNYSEFNISSNWEFVLVQIILRSLNPLHITTAMIATVGIVEMFNQTDDYNLDWSNSRIFLPYYFLAVVIHGMWNGNLQLTSEDNYIWVLPIFNWILMGVMIIGFLLIIYKYGSIFIPNCDICGNWHVIGLKHQHIVELNQPVSISNTEKVGFQCKNCSTTFNTGRCSNCETVEVFSCANCKYPLPIFARKCWKCNVDITPMYDNLVLIEEEEKYKLARSFFYLFAFMYVGQFLMLLFNLTGETNFGNSFNQIILFMIITSVMIIAIYLNQSSEYKLWGLIISRYMSGLIILLLGLLFYLFSITFLSGKLLGPGLFLIFIGSIFTIISLKIISLPAIYVRL